MIFLEFEKSKTYQNLWNAYSGELSTSTKYRIYGDKAREDGFEQIGSIFDKASHEEKEHAVILLELIREMPTTVENLQESLADEAGLSHLVFESYAETARQEGYDQIADLFDELGGISRNQQRRFSILLENIEEDDVFCKPDEQWWVCMNCGHLHNGKCAPPMCPVCAYPQGFYKLYCENF